MVMQFLSDSEIVTVAMNLENEGYEFYNKAARISKQRESKDVFNKLKDEEKEHHETFKELLGSISKNDSRDYFDISQQTASYLNSLVETGVFKGKEKAAFKKMNEIEVLEIGLNAERDSILFYTQAMEISKDRRAGDILSRIIEIEKGHLILLANRLRVARKLF